MQAVPFPARARTQYRHELRTLTYVTLDEANGGIIRNLNDKGVAVQAVAALRPRQRVRLRFELRFPRLRVETYGQVAWASRSGQCGIRFVDPPSGMQHQINQWIFSNLLDAAARDSTRRRSVFGPSVVSIACEEQVGDERVAQADKSEQDKPEENDGLSISGVPRPAIRLAPLQGDGAHTASEVRAENDRAENDRSENVAHSSDDLAPPPDWLSRPVSARTLAWLIDSLVVIIALLMFALIFLSITHELPRWPLTLLTAFGAAVFVVAAYRAMFALLGGPSLGARLAQATSSAGHTGERSARGDGTRVLGVRP